MKKTHGCGNRHNRTYRSWASMKQRCNNPNATCYYKYGARGIKVCERWDLFVNFLADMGERPEQKTLDRIDNNGNYEPSNCRWATLKEQANNVRPKPNAVAEVACSVCKKIFKPRSNKAPNKFCSHDCMAISMIGHERNGAGCGWRSMERKKRLLEGKPLGNELNK